MHSTGMQEISSSNTSVTFFFEEVFITVIHVCTLHVMLMKRIICTVIKAINGGVSRVFPKARRCGGAPR